MALHQKITKDGRDSLTIILADGTIKAITDEHPGFQSILTALSDGSTDDQIKALLDPAQLIYAKTSKVSERVTLAGGTLLFDGDPIENALADFIVNISQNSDNADSYSAWVNFMEKLATNPSEESREHLFHFMLSHGLTVNPSGDIILYKGVNEDGTSIHAGYGIVDGNPMTGNLPNEVGSVLEFPRSDVNSNRGIGCATGLHAGTYDYASSFSRGRLLTVSINPRDVVSVPSDSGNAKVRVCRYTVVEINKHGEAYSTPVWGAADDGDFDDTSEDVDVFFDDDEDEEAEPEESSPEDTTPTPAPAPTQAFEDKVQEALTRIPSVIKGGWTKSLSHYASKHVTAANRDAWREAIRRTGLR